MRPVEKFLCNRSHRIIKLSTVQGRNCEISGLAGSWSLFRTDDLDGHLGTQKSQKYKRLFHCGWIDAVVAGRHFTPYVGLQFVPIRRIRCFGLYIGRDGLLLVGLLHLPRALVRFPHLSRQVGADASASTYNLAA